MGGVCVMSYCGECGEKKAGGVMGGGCTFGGYSWCRALGKVTGSTAKGLNVSSASGAPV